ncbi:hypothetical protein BK120_25305 [Paenibacillus sp. FSL A5-0031]|uniref:hypothetical protein n=1 Tax=Paenibacillus sp. FSL A5-0031 TaxID=1920420 RepID=UPI00096D1C28|nr:hypothetical protein [Paenibacillus sp. FSL A5-0031]OME78014.1 hypothetical protein BK120_25305 [Paenibacillus sp. FSL A5-0031]
MKINKKYNYWVFYFDETNDDDRQRVAAIWDGEWHSIELLDKSDAELKEYLIEVIDDYNVYTGEKINRNLIEHAINEIKKIKEELNFLG